MSEAAELVPDHRVPAVERAIAILDAIEATPSGLSLLELSDRCNVPRSTAYRILNSLIAARLVQRQEGGASYVMGTRLLGRPDTTSLDRDALIRLARPALERLTRDTGAASKLSVLDGDMALCIEVVAGTSSYSVAPIIGRLWPLHTGGAGKLLLADQDEAFMRRLLTSGLSRHTARTITDPALLSHELDEVREQGWAEDRGEHMASVAALAAPVRDRDGRVIAAVSIAYFREMHEAYRQSFRSCICDCAASISQAIATGRN